MTPTEPTEEDLEELSWLFELDEIYSQQEEMERWAEQEEAERERERPHSYGHPAQEPEFDRSEEEENFPD
jgi:hypothetical protein